MTDSFSLTFIFPRKFENFELFCPLGAMKLGVQDSTYIFFFRRGLRVRVRVEMGTKSEKVCMKKIF